MKRTLFVFALMMLVGSQSLAKDFDINIPSMSGKIEMMEDLGMVDHVDPIQYDRIHGIRLGKAMVAKAATGKKSQPQSQSQVQVKRQVAGLSAQ